MAKKGYTKINNDLFQKYLPTQELTGSEFRVLIHFIGDTICFNRRYNPKGSAFSRISVCTGLSVRQTKRVIASLIEKGYLKMKAEGKGKHPQIIEINGDIFGYFWGHVRSTNGDTVGQKMTENVTQEIKEEIKDKEIKEEEKASPQISLEELARLSYEVNDDD